jgi:hypothetical protein
MNDPKDMNEQLSEALQAAYPADQPDERLHGRMVESERNHRLQSYTRKSGWKKGWFTLIGGLALLSVLGFTAYKYFFDRPGEAAIALIPADADLVVTLDTNPSTQQLATFHKIATALKQEGILEKLDDTLTAVLNQNPVARRIRPYVAKSMALAVWMPSVGFDRGPEPDGAFFLALTNAEEVDSILSDSIPNDRSHGFTIYNVDKKVFGAVIGNYLVVGPNANVLSKINMVRSGSGQSVAQLPEYQNARASLAADANLMAFVSPDALAAMDQGKNKGMNPMQGFKWMAMGMALRDAGLEFTFQCPMNQAKMPSLKHLAEIKPLDMNVLNRLPEGAYGVLAYSQVAKYWDFIGETASQDPKAKNEMEKGLAEFEKQTGISIDNDIVPAFGGNLMLAVYPSPTMGADSADGILMIDDANGANPAAMVDKVRGFIEKATAKEGKPIKFVSQKQGDVTIWRLDSGSQREFANKLANGKQNKQTEALPEPPVMLGEADVQGDAVPAEPKGVQDLSDGDRDVLAKIEAHKKDTPPALEDKTLIYAQIGNSVVIASSEAMMTRALQAYRGGGRSLADDPAFAGMQGRVHEGAQNMIMVNLHGIMQILRPKIEESNNGPVSVDDIVNIFGGPNTGLVGSGRYDGQVMVGELFMPLDYQRLVKMMGQGMRHEDAVQQQHQLSIRDAPRLAPQALRATRILAKL